MNWFFGLAEKLLWVLFLLLIPTQLGKHFWFEWSNVWGVRSDYLSPTLYLIDLVWIGLLLLNLFKGKQKVSFGLFVGILFAIVNVLISENKGVAIYRWLRIMQWWWTFEVILKKKDFIKTILVGVVPVWIAVESLLGLAQLINGGSLNGIWWWLGERKFSLTTVGIAQMSVFGQGVLRAYGTFSHPNSMAGFLLVTWLWWVNITQKRSWKWWSVVWLGLLGIVISGSRTVWLLVMLYLVAWGARRLSGRKLWGMGVIGLGLIIVLLSVLGRNYRLSDYLGGWDSDSLEKRMSLNMIGFKMWKENLMIGVGAGNFINRLPDYQRENPFYWWQPIHNVYLLAVVEVGILGVVWIGSGILAKRVDKWKGKRKVWWVLAAVVITGMVDHYWLTLPQNSWLLAVVLAIL